MSIPDTCAIIRKLNQPNQFGEEYRIDFHRYREGKIKEHLLNYEIDSKERAYAMLRGDTWVKDRYDIIKILEMKENDKIPGQEKPILEMLSPTYHTYKLDIEQFEGYLNTWLKNKKGIEIDVKVYAENGGGYASFWFGIADEQHQKLLGSLYNVHQYIEYEVVEPVMQDIFDCDRIEFEYDLNRACLMVYKPIEK